MPCKVRRAGETERTTGVSQHMLALVRGRNIGRTMGRGVRTRGENERRKRRHAQQGKEGATGYRTGILHASSR